ncbi:GumC family protein [Psychromarinibacter sp. S121]|uniref:GumC family protein n=1 Tax=Psychromarinibacter sp. S121 TaxID=3415127 RepID=UPI003C7B1423
MDDLKFYFSIFLRRLPWFVVLATVITAVAVAVAISLPPAYVSQMRLVVESPQIPDELAASTVRTPALEQLQIIEQRLLTRANLLDISRRLEVLPDIEQMNPDEIVRAMRARTQIYTQSGRDAATMMVVSFEAADPNKAAGVLNEYLNIIQEADAEFRRGRAGDTLEFFQQEVQRLDGELSAQSARIIAFKQQNSDALPDTLEFRMSKRADFQERIAGIDRDIERLERQRLRLRELYETTGRTELNPEQNPPTLAEQQLRDLRGELAEARLVFSDQNPKVRLLQRRIERLEVEIAEAAAARIDEIDDEPTDPNAAPPTILDLQIAEIDGEIAGLEEQKTLILTELEALNETIERTPEVSISLDELERTYSIIETQYNLAEDRLSQAQTGDMIESRSRGQRISVIEQPNTPNAPTKPNRALIAGGGGLLGIGAGIALIVLLELLNSSVRRPEDLVKRFGISPLATVPYVRSRRQLFFQRGFKVLIILGILIGVPAAIYAVHVFYLPIDLVAEKVMNRLGVRW